MKKIPPRFFFREKEFRKIFVVMRLTIFLLVLGLLKVQANSYSQNSTLNLKLQDVEIKQVLEAIQNQSEYKFFYLTEQVDMKQKVSVEVTGATITKILDQILLPYNLAYQVMENNLIVIMPAENASGGPVKIKGKVTDKKNGDPIPGVNIIVKGTTTGTITDFEGLYSIEAESENLVLTFSYIGYLSQEIPYTGQTEINVKLEEDLKSIDEVIVIGYGTSSKKDITGSISSVSGEMVAAVPVTKVEEALKGRVAGVQVVQGNSAPGSDPMIVIRGRNSIYPSASPLWIVDGYPFAGSVNPNDVESITVLKDASATAIYGSRGSNGVILVTTKKGTRKKQQLEFSASYSVSKIRNKIDLLSAEDWVNVGKPESERVAWEGPDTDWQDEVMRPAPRQEYNLSYAGGTEKSRTYFSLNYKDVDGIMKESYYQSMQARINTERQISKNFKVTNMMSLNTSQKNDVNAAFESLLFPPIYDIMDEEGNYTYISSVGLTNPVGIVQERINKNRSFSFYDFLSAELTLFKDLTLKTSAGATVRNNHDMDFWPHSMVNVNSGMGEAGQGYGFRANWVNENQITYQKTIGANHNVKATGFFSQEYTRNQGFDAYNALLLTEVLGYHGLDLNDTMQSINTYANKETLMSFGARFDYNFKNKYYLTATFRRDASSKFSTGNKWANFPAVALSWRVNEEAFLKDVSQISNLKLRISYGKTGNQAIPVSRSRLQYVISDRRAIFNNVSQFSLVRNVIENPDLTWETTDQYNGGVDLSVLNDRLTLTMDYYYKLTSDLLFQRELGGAAGGGVMYINKGKVRNKGLELGITGHILSKPNLNWFSTLNYSYNRNLVVDLMDTKTVHFGNHFGGWINDETHFLSEGYPMGIFYGFQVEGIFADEEDVENHTTQKAIKPAPGEFKLKDINNDGEVNDMDKTIIGNAEPDFIFGWNNEVSYKGLSLSLFLQGSVGNEIYNIHNVALLGGLKTYNRSGDYANAWSPENMDTDVPKPSAIATKSLSTYVEDGSYIRLRDITLSYELPPSIVERAKLSGLTLSLSAQNYLTFTKYKGYDPEVSYRYSNIWQGIDWHSYPTTKSITFSLKLQL